MDGVTIAVSAAILTGGRATRMDGRDKSALVIGGRTILDRQVEALAPLTDDIMIVGSAADPATLEPEAIGDGPRRIADRVADCGPLGGLDAALHNARHDQVLLLACDMPFVTHAFLAHLVERAGGADAVVPRTERGYHPLCGVYRREATRIVERQLAARRLKMTDLLDALRVCVVSSAEVERFGDRHRLLANVNTPSDLARHEL